ncbi:YdcF family protein [Gordonia alkanivorans]|uniref:YdcF family protein n=1 Tax=Gordonia alkanivorans TaxID=84096 RepID=UPI00244A2E88|nr:YdcF family protein [Gordonia alkanivorans]MDH3043848.1 YdcF family protein [Gordonia alkanivorans]
MAASLSLDSGEGLPSWLFVTVVYPMFAVPLVLLVLALFLVVNTVVVVRRERLSLATVAPAAIGVLILMTLVSLVIQFVALICSASPEGRLIFLLLPIAASPGVVLIFELVAYTVYAFVYSRIGTDDVADVVVVLGSGLAGDQVTPLLASRLDAGIAAFERSREAGHNPVMVVSGGKGSDERRSEAEAMAEYVVKEGISRDQVILEAASTSTRENLEFSVATLAERKISWTMMAIATSNFHIMRAASLARQLGIPTLSVGARTAVYYLPSAFLREFAASVVHFRRGTAVASAVVMAAWIAISWYVLSLFDAVRSTL